MTTKLELLRESAEKIKTDLKCRTTKLTRIHKSIANLKRRERKLLETFFANRVLAPNIQSRIYIVEDSPDNLLKNGKQYDLPGFPLEEVGGERQLSLRYISSKNLGYALGKIDAPGIKQEKGSFPTIFFKELLVLPSYSVYFLDTLFGRLSTLRSGNATTYRGEVYMMYRTIHHPGHSAGSWGYNWWEEAYDEEVPNSEGYRIIENTAKTPMAILSARTSSDLNKLEKKLGLI